MSVDLRPIDLAITRFRFGLTLLAAAGLSFACGEAPADPERKGAPPAPASVAIGTERGDTLPLLIVTYLGLVTAVEPSGEPVRIGVSEGNAADTVIVRVENWPAQSARAGAR